MKDTAREWRAPVEAASAALFLFVYLSLLLISSAGFTEAAAVPASTASTCTTVVSELYYLANGEDYRGVVNYTLSGSPCQNWSVQTPNQHDTVLDPSLGIGNHNYCRNSNNLKQPGCFSAVEGEGYQYCDVGPVCTESPFAKPAVWFSPVSGSNLFTGGGSGNNFVRIECYPRPCSIHYTLGSNSIASANGIAYSQPIALSSSTVVKAYTEFEGYSPMQVQARYTVHSSTDLIPSSTLHFFPSDSIVYTYPIDVELQGVGPADEVLIYLNDDVQHPLTTPTGAIRLNSTTKLTAVVNGTYLAEALYTFNITIPPLLLYPPAGQYVGGISVLVQDTAPPSTYYMYVNESKRYTPLSDLEFNWTAVGQSRLDIRALHTHGVESKSVVLYEILAADPPRIQPAAAVIYTYPINISCTDPRGTTLQLTVLSNSSGDVVSSGTHAVRLSHPGVFQVQCSYADDLDVVHRTTATMQLQAAALTPPALSPVCGMAFPGVTLSLQARIDASTGLPSTPMYERSLQGAVTGTGRVLLITRDAEDDALFYYDVDPISTTEPVNITVSVTAVSSDPMEGNSDPSTCSYLIYPVGSSQSLHFYALPSCAVAMEPIDATCLLQLRRKIATCLFFYGTELIALKTLGPFIDVQISGLDAALQSSYTTRLGQCMEQLAADGDVSRVERQDTSNLTLATSWRVIAAPDGNASHVITGVPVTVKIEGYRAQDGLYHLARAAYDCEDIGLVPEKVEANATVAGDTGSGGVTVVFRIPVVGEYKMCAYIGDALYTVPFRLTTSDESNSGMDDGHAYLTVIPVPWPRVALAAAAPCGGLVGTQTEMAVSAAATPASVYNSVLYSIGSGDWKSTPLAAAVIQFVWQPSAVQPMQVVDLSLGSSTGAAVSCVYYSSASNPAVSLKGLNYSFYRVPSPANTTASTQVILLLSGSFNPGELIHLELYRSTASNAKLAAAAAAVAGEEEVVDRMSFRASEATAYAVALPERVVALPYSSDATTLNVRASFDGQSVTVPPASVALSSLAASMTTCPTSQCTSGYIFEDKCVCRDASSSSAGVVRLCAADSGGGDSSSSSSGSSSSGGNHDDATLTTSAGVRFLFLFLYLLLLAAIAGSIAFFVWRSTVREAAARRADVVIDNC